MRTRWRLIFGLVLAPVALAPSATVAQLTNTPTSITAQHSSKCLDVYGGSVANGAAVIQWTCHGGANQQWSLRPYLDAFQIVARHSGKCLNVEGASTADGARAIQWPCAGANNELWYASPRGSGYELVARHSAKCLAVNGGLTTDGAQVVQWSCDGSANQRWSIPAGGGSGGRWSGVINFPLVPVAAANLTDGKLLVWSARDRFSFGGDLGRTYTAIFDPATSSATERLVTETGHDMFCPGTSMLSDGSVFVTGGSSASKTSIYNPASDSWSAAAPMMIPRGYQSSATLSNGGVFTVGGSWSGGQGNKDGEVWTSGAGWRRLSGVPDNPILGPDPGGVYRADNHTWLFGVGNGRVFHAGPSANMNWIDTNGSGSIVSAGRRGDDAYSMNGNAVMYDIGKILKLGGAPAYQNANATSSAYVIDINAGVSVRKVAPMAYARAMHNSVVLPNGQVVIIGGQAYAVPFSDDRSVLAPELWDPASETFTTLAPMQVPRNYHSVALLLPDGRVFSAGGGLCGSCATNHANAQILTPPYLLNADGTPAARPGIVSAPASAAHGTSVTITTDSAVSSFALMRMGSVTHSVNTDQRRVPLSYISTGPNTYSVAIPSDPGVAIPGYYMLFALNGAGVPSVARVMRLETGPAPAQITFRAAASATATGVTPAFRAAASAATTGATLTIARPTGVAANDVMIASIGVRPSTASLTPPAGWTLVRRVNNPAANSNSLAVYRKLAGAAEPASYAWGVTGATIALGGIQAFFNVDTANPIDVENGQTTASALAHATPSVVTTVANTLVVTSHTFSSAATWTPPAGMTEGFDIATPTPPNVGGQAIEGSRVPQAAAGATGIKTATAANDADVGNTHILALRPAGLTINTPAGTTVNDVMLASIGVRPSTATITPPAGWTLVRRINNASTTANSLAVYSKVAGAAEPASYTWTLAGSTHAAGGIQAFFNVDTATPIDVENGQATVSALAHATPSVVTTVANTMLVTSHTFSTAATWTPPTGMTESFDIATPAPPNAVGQAIEGNRVPQAAAGATGVKTATAAADADVGNTHILALRPATPGP